MTDFTRYAPGLETPEPDEDAVDAGMIAQFAKIQGTTFADDGHAVRGAHAKAHRPLGATMRARRAIYPVSAGFRAARNGGPLHEPASAAGLAV